jgi:hypothetical protein
MNSSRNILVFSVVICAGVLASKHAQAGGFKFGGGSGNGGGSNHSFKINHGNNKSSQNQFKNGSPFNKFWKNDNHDNHDNHDDHHGHHHHHHHKYRVRCLDPVIYVYSRSYYPTFQSCFVYPGDTWYTISQQHYGMNNLGKHISGYNGLTMSSPLTVGQMLRLPVVYSNGTLGVSNAPMPAPFSSRNVGTAANQLGQATASAANNGTVANEPTLPQVAIGSTLALDGESHGAEKGIVRLRVSGLALPVDVVEWTEKSLKIQLPKMDLSNPVKAELEVVRADGGMASKSGIELTPAAPRVALGKQ